MSKLSLKTKIEAVFLACVLTGIFSSVVTSTYLSYTGPNGSYAWTSTDQSFITCSNGNRYNATYTNIQTACNNISSIGWVKLAPTTYTATGTITVTNKTIDIIGNGAVINFSGLNDVVFKFQDTVSRGVLHCSVSDMYLIGDDTDTLSVFVNFSNVIGEISGLKSNGSHRMYQFGMFYGACDGSSIHDNEVIALNGIILRGSITTGANGTSITDNEFRGNYISGVDPFNTCINVTYAHGVMISENFIGGKFIADGYTGGYCYGVTAYEADSISISDNSYLCGSVIGVYITDAFSPKVVNNFFPCEFNSCIGIKISGCIYGGTITDNTIYSTNNQGWHGMDFYGNKRIIINGNEIIQGTIQTNTYGIYGTGTNSEFNINGNIFTGVNAGNWTGIYFASMVDGSIQANIFRLINYPIRLITNTTNLVANNANNT